MLLVNQRTFYGHGFKFANCKRLPEGNYKTLQLMGISPDEKPIDQLVQDFAGPSTVAM